MNSNYFKKYNPAVSKIFLAMLVPTILMNLTTALASFADTVIIGYFLDDKSLSVVTYATPIYMIINTFAALFAVGGSISMSIEAGKSDRKSAHKLFSLSVELLAFSGLILLFAGVFFADGITHWLGAGDDVFEMVKTYSAIVLIGGPVFMLNVGMAFFVRNDGRPNLSMVGMFLSIIINIIFDIVFIGFFEMGISGAAYATVLGQLVSVLVISGHFFTKKNTLRFYFNINKNVFRIFKNGSSTALHFVYQFATILILNHIISKLAGTNGVVVYTVVFNLYTVSLALFEGISQTIQPMVSLYYGEKSYTNIKATLHMAFITTLIVCGAVTLILEIVPGVVPMVFGISDAELFSKASVAVRIFSVSMIIMTVNVVLGYYLQSTERSVMSGILVSLRCFVIFLLSVFVVGRIFGLNGVWASYTVAEVVSFAVYILMIALERKKLSKKGINADMFLLNKSVQASFTSYIFKCGKDDFNSFKSHIENSLSNDYKFKSNIKDDCIAYLNELSKSNIKSNGKYIAFEITGADEKVIIRDNLDHSLCNNIRECTVYGSCTDYSPVLGWNRISLK